MESCEVARHVNPVYTHLKQLVKDVENNTERPPRTSVELFVRSRDIFVGINPTSTATTKLIATTFVDEQLSNDTFYGIYIHSMHPLSTMVYQVN
jgi:hypothetical protein